MVRQRRHTPEQVIRKLREAERLQAQGATIPEIAKQLEISNKPSTGGATGSAG